jgi:four helix bundle protein
VAESEQRRAGGARSFEDLWIWQQARALVPFVYQDFGENSPAGRDFGFRNQVQRSAISIMNNIAEGFGRMTDTDFARLLDIAKGSTGEVRSMYYAAQDLKYVATDIAEERRTRCRQIGSAISALASHLRPTGGASPRRSRR